MWRFLLVGLWDIAIARPVTFFDRQDPSTAIRAMFAFPNLITTVHGPVPALVNAITEHSLHFCALSAV
jgi:hypothetical protein